MIKFSVYVVDDEESIREGLEMSLGSDYEVSVFPDGESALKAVAENSPDLILLDIGLPGMNGIAVLDEVKKLRPEVLIVMITAYEDVNTAISAMKLGAYDYIIKPLQMETLEITIQNALNTVRLRKEVQELQEKYISENVPCFIGESDVIQDVMEFISMVAKSPNTPILILGETGTCKELIARAIHFKSPNFKGPLVTVNCAAIPKDLIESELFGYEKGAFSGARDSGKKGLIEESAEGTLFLDEVGDLSIEAQAKLLRFLENGEFYRVGGTRVRKVKTRVVSATNKDIEALMINDMFRKDLFFRLGVIKVEVPSLNERADCIIPLAKNFLDEFCSDFNKDISGISSEAEQALLHHDWIGNVRELKNVVERGVLTCKGNELVLEDLGLKHGEHSRGENLPQSDSEFPDIPDEGIDFQRLQESMEKYYIERALEMAGGNESKAARLLGVNHHTFRYHKKKLDIK